MKVNIRSVECIAELKTSLSRYSNDALDIINQFNRECQRTQDWLVEREQHWAKETQKYKQELTIAQDALRNCMQQGNCDSDGRYRQADYSYEQVRIRTAEQSLKNAERELQNVQCHVKKVSQVSGEFSTTVRRFLPMLDIDLKRATNFLNQLSEQLGKYLSEHAEGGHISGVTLNNTSSAIGFSQKELTAIRDSKQTGKKRINQNNEFARFGELQSNKDYSHNLYTHTTDNKGRVINVSGQLILRAGQRTRHQTEVGHSGKTDDEGGHLIAKEFDGSPQGYNLVPQNINLNRSRWRKMENKWKKALKVSEDVYVSIKLGYKSKQAMRPDLFISVYQISGKLFTEYYKNRSGG